MFGMDDFKDVSQNTLERYSKRYDDLGKHIRALGWGSEQQQEYRFAQALAGLNLEGKHLLDIGCGFGDLLSFCDANEIKLGKYTGVDINPNFVDEARKQFSGDNRASFELFDLVSDESDRIREADVGIMLGLLNYNLKNEAKNYAYTEHMIRKALPLVNEMLIVDFLSTHHTDTYPVEDFVFYHDPAKMVDMGLSLGSDVVLKHNYEPIPQKEFFIYLYR